MQSARVYRQLNMHIELVLVGCQHVYGMRHQSCDTPTSPAFACNVSYLISSRSCDRTQFSFLQADDCHGASIHRCHHIQGLLHFLARDAVDIVTDQHQSACRQFPATSIHTSTSNLLGVPQRLLDHYCRRGCQQVTGCK